MHQQVAGSAGKRGTDLAVGQVELRLFQSRSIAFKRRTDTFDSGFVGAYRFRGHFRGRSNLGFLHPCGETFFRKLLEPRCFGLRVLRLRAVTGEVGLGRAKLSFVLS